MDSTLELEVTKTKPKYPKLQVISEDGHLGEAKQNRERRRRQALADVDLWSFPPTDWEAETVREIQRLPTVQALRFAEHKLAYMRMHPRECFANTRFYQENDPTGLSEQVLGWWPQNDNYVLHAVIKTSGKYFCLTPSPHHPENPFEFIPDPLIKLREIDGFRVAFRKDFRIGPGVRTDPKKTLAQCDTLRERLNSGMEPHMAMLL